MVRLTQVNFSKGELAPHLYGRFDVESYQGALKTARNVFVLKYGGVCKRPGTWLVSEVLDSTAPTRLIPFQFSITQAYALEFGTGYVAPCLNGGRLLETAHAVAAITNAAQAQVSIVGHGFAVGDFLFPAGIAGAMGDLLNGRLIRVAAVIDANTFSIALDTSTAEAFAPTGAPTMARVYRFAAGYAGADLSEITFAQTSDTIYLAHIDYPPSKIVRSGATDWAFSSVTFGTKLAAPTGLSIAGQAPNNPQGAYFPTWASYCVTAYDDDTGYESLASVAVESYLDLTLNGNYNQVSWTAVAGATRYRVYKSSVGEFWGYIGTTESTSIKDNNIGPDYSQSPPKHYNPFASAGDYPSSVTLFQQRLIWARSQNTPHGIWASRSAQIENMDRSRPLVASDSINFAIVSGQANAINALTSTNTLLALTSDAVFLVDADGQGGILVANSGPASRRQIGRGSSRLAPIVVDSVVFYSPSVGTTVRTLGFDYVVDGLKTNDVSIFSPHLFEGHSIVSWCYAQEPRSLIWAVRDDGVLLCFTWEQDQNVWGWTHCDTDGKVLSVCAIPEDGENRVYLTVERTIGGKTKRFIERMASHLWDDVAQSCFVDCAVTATFDTPQSSVSGLWHLEGRTDVAGIVDGQPVSGLTVSNGTVTLPASVGEGTVITLGIPYQVDIETLPLRMNDQVSGSNVGRIQGAQQAALILRDTMDISAGIDASRLYTVRRRDEQAWQDPTSLMNGDHLVMLDNKIRDTTSIHVRQTSAMPLTLLGVALDAFVNG